MRVVGLDGLEHDWRPTSRPRGECSSYHRAARALLRSVFPCDAILEEVFLPGSGGLHADFYLPLRRLMVEVQGEQHFTQVDHFHGDRLGFLRARLRDDDKRRWCGLNGIALVGLPFDEDEHGWRQRVREAR
jgi:hypothetical protein